MWASCEYNCRCFNGCVFSLFSHTNVENKFPEVEHVTEKIEMRMR